MVSVSDLAKERVELVIEGDGFDGGDFYDITQMMIHLGNKKAVRCVLVFTDENGDLQEVDQTEWLEREIKEG